jgi:hypothetical protein
MSNMSAHEFAEWIAFSQIEPWGMARADWQAALICKIMADINTPKGKQPMKLTDFLLKFDQERKEQSTEEMIGTVAQINAIYGEQDNEGGG